MSLNAVQIFVNKPQQSEAIDVEILAEIKVQIAIWLSESISVHRANANGKRFTLLLLVPLTNLSDFEQQSKFEKKRAKEKQKLQRKRERRLNPSS